NAGQHTWGTEPAIPIAMDGRDVSCETMLSVYGTEQSVWIMYFHPNDGLSFDRIGADLSYAHNPLGASPQPDGHQNGFGSFAVSPDDHRIWAVWDGLIAATPLATAQGYWDGTQWTILPDTTHVGDSWGIAGSLYWDNGLAATRLDPNTFEIYVST